MPQNEEENYVGFRNGKQRGSFRAPGPLLGCSDAEQREERRHKYEALHRQSRRLISLRLIDADLPASGRDCGKGAFSGGNLNPSQKCGSGFRARRGVAK
jgi:hypothetical protein